jgi:hypothetical protein
MLLNYCKGIQIRKGVFSEIDEATVIEDRFRIFFDDYPMIDVVASRDQRTDAPGTHHGCIRR